MRVLQRRTRQATWPDSGGDVMDTTQTKGNTMKIDDGGEAFPTSLNHGMDLRDWFAGQALAGALRSAGGSDVIARRAYRIADAMIAAKREDEG